MASVFLLLLESVKVALNPIAESWVLDEELPIDTELRAQQGYLSVLKQYQSLDALQMKDAFLIGEVYNRPWVGAKTHHHTAGAERGQSLQKVTQDRPFASAQHYRFRRVDSLLDVIGAVGKPLGEHSRPSFWRDEVPDERLFVAVHP